LLSIDNINVESCCRIVPDSHPGVIALKLFPGLPSSKGDLAVMENGVVGPERFDAIKNF
jgi:hypothetical protein